MYKYEVEFRQYMENVLRHGESCVHNNVENVRQYVDWLKSINLTVEDCGAEHFKICMQENREGYRKSVNVLFMQCVKNFSAFLMAYGHRDSSLVAPNEDAIGRDSWKITEITMSAIRYMRAQPGMYPDFAALFEVLLSSGMRKAEVISVRCNMIDFTIRPIDSETGKRAKLCGGGIYLDGTEVDVKNSKPRVVYFSKAAAKALKVYIKVNMINMNSTAPLFPVNANYSMKKVGESWFNMKFDADMEARKEALLPSNEISDDEDTESKRGKLKRANEIAEYLEETHPFHDKASKAEANLEKILKRKRKTKKNLKRSFRERIKTNKKGEPIPEVLNPHSLRHFWAAVSYFKSIDGQRRNLNHVSWLAGHVGTVTTMDYIAERNVINEMNEWEEVWQPNAMHWPMMKMMPIPYNGSRGEAKRMLDKIRNRENENEN